jgi:hypothetical protein
MISVDTFTKRLKQRVAEAEAAPAAQPADATPIVKPKRTANTWATAASEYYRKEKERRPELTFKIALQELKVNTPK